MFPLDKELLQGDPLRYDIALHGLLLQSLELLDSFLLSLLLPFLKDEFSLTADSIHELWL